MTRPRPPRYGGSRTRESRSSSPRRSKRQQTDRLIHDQAPRTFGPRGLMRVPSARLLDVVALGILVPSGVPVPEDPCLLGDGAVTATAGDAVPGHGRPVRILPGGDVVPPDSLDGCRRGRRTEGVVAVDPVPH